MSVTRMVGLTACILLLTGIASAEIEVVEQALDYTYSSNFYTPGEIGDHQPHYRGSWEDWGWTHDVSDLVPENATGISSAQLAITAWDVDYLDGEIDVISVNGTRVGILGETYGRYSKTFYFTLSEDILDDLWQDGELYVYMDIDQGNTGQRVRLDQSSLIVSYIINGEIPEPATIGLLGLGGLVMLRRRRS